MWATTAEKLLDLSKSQRLDGEEGLIFGNLIFGKFCKVSHTGIDLSLTRSTDFLSLGCSYVWYVVSPSFDKVSRRCRHVHDDVAPMQVVVPMKLSPRRHWVKYYTAW